MGGSRTGEQTGDSGLRFPSTALRSTSVPSMWQPEPEWERLPRGAGAATAGLWRTERGGRTVVIKRLTAPLPGDPAEFTDPASPGWWRREADVAIDGIVDSTQGLRAVPTLEVHEDEQGISLVQPFLPGDGPGGLFVAAALGRFAATDLPPRPWLARQQLRSRLTRIAGRGGWPTLARTSIADLSEHLWSRRTDYLDRLDALPQVPQHGDPVPGNMHARSGTDVLALDWGTLGTGPVGADLGYWSLSTREEFDPLVDAYLSSLGSQLCDPDAVLLGARVTAAYTVLSRAEWALARVAGGDGALAGKFRHPSVSPHLLAVQRQFPQLEALVGGVR